MWQRLHMCWQHCKRPWCWGHWMADVSAATRRQGPGSGEGAVQGTMPASAGDNPLRRHLVSCDKLCNRQRRPQPSAAGAGEPSPGQQQPPHCAEAQCNGAAAACGAPALATWHRMLWTAGAKHRSSRRQTLRAHCSCVAYPCLGCQSSLTLLWGVVLGCRSLQHPLSAGHPTTSWHWMHPLMGEAGQQASPRLPQQHTQAPPTTSLACRSCKQRCRATRPSKEPCGRQQTPASFRTCASGTRVMRSGPLVPAVTVALRATKLGFFNRLNVVRNGVRRGVHDTPRCCFVNAGLIST